MPIAKVSGIPAAAKSLGLGYGTVHKWVRCGARAQA
jgi:transposase